MQCREWTAGEGGAGGEGRLSREYVNGVGACRIFLTAILERRSRWPRESAHVLGRADVDWSQPAAYLAGSRMARPLLAALRDSELTRWAPGFFVEWMSVRAIQDGLCGLVQREAIRRIASTLRDIGGRGILLKGSALLVLEEDAEDSLPMRATGDIDLYVGPPLAPMLSRKLIESGFGGAVDAARSAPHHLAPVSFQGIPVELHTRIMPAFWGLPKQELLAQACRVDGMDSLCTLDPERFLLHAGMHATTHLFS